ncbi:MAG TPA: molecular chaperone DnaJ [Acidimicrobiales bacterium]
MTDVQREWLETDYYRVLGVPADADAKTITKAYRKLARENHPDQNPGDAKAEDRFKEASAAYDVLGDAEKRKRYDEVRTMAANGFGGFGGAGGFGGPAGAGGFTFDGDAGGFGDILSDLFGSGGRGRAARRAGPAARRGADLEASLHLGFADAVRGVTTSVHLSGEAACTTCKGTGAKPGTAPRVCPTCGGRGVTSDDQGPFSFSTLCAQCQGRGQVVDDPCPTCRGTGTALRRREVKVRIPSGVTNGQRVRLKGRGGPGINGGPAGDLYVVVSVDSDPIFGRRGRDLTIDLPVTFAEAALGTDVEVPVLDGDRVRIRIPAGTPSGKVLRVKGRGVPADGRRKAGDLRVTVAVSVPSTLDRRQRKAVEALAEVLDESPRSHLS